ncbi:MAG TPA: hypothetical protein VMH50_17160 [Thermoleophilia bacterium]|nr:hypothetical protein [Thermoleophilia bacterium]
MRQHGLRVLSERDRMLLRFIAEQYLVTLPQLAYLADRCPRTARWLRTRWQRAGLIDATPLLVEEPTVVWLTRCGLAALGLPWKSVRPSYGGVQTAATLVELRLAAHTQYPQARWLSRRMLGHASPAPSPLPDAVLTADRGSVAVLVKARELDRRELERQLIPLIAAYEHTLLVLPAVSRHTRDWLEEFAEHATAISCHRDPRLVTLPQLPPLLALEHGPALPSADWIIRGDAVDRCAVSPTSPHTARS